MFKVSIVFLYWILSNLCLNFMNFEFVSSKKEKPTTVQGLICHESWYDFSTQDEPDDVKTRECCKKVGSCNKYRHRGHLINVCFFSVSDQKETKFRKCCDKKQRRFKHHSYSFTKTFAHQRVMKMRIGESCNK